MIFEFRDRLSLHAHKNAPSARFCKAVFIFPPDPVSILALLLAGARGGEVYHISPDEVGVLFKNIPYRSLEGGSRASTEILVIRGSFQSGADGTTVVGKSKK